MFDKTFAPMCTELSKPFNDTNKRYVASVIYDETAKIIYILPNWQAESRNKKTSQPYSSIGRICLLILWVGRLAFSAVK